MSIRTLTAFRRGKLATRGWSRSPGEEMRSATTYIVRRGAGGARTTVTEAVRPELHRSRTKAYFGLSFELTAKLLPERSGTKILLEAQTHWPKGLGLLGQVVEFAVLNAREANRELERLRVLVESEAADESPHH